MYPYAHTHTHSKVQVHTQPEAKIVSPVVLGLQIPPRLKRAPHTVQPGPSPHSQTTSLTWASRPPSAQPSQHRAPHQPTLTIHTRIIYSSALVDWTHPHPQDRYVMDLKLGEGCFNIVVDIVNSEFSKITAKVDWCRPIFFFFFWKDSSQGSKERSWYVIMYLCTDLEVPQFYLVAKTGARRPFVEINTTWKSESF